MIVKQFISRASHSNKPVLLKWVKFLTTAAKDIPIGWEEAKPFSEMPGPAPAPILGNFWRFLPKIGTFANLQPHEMSFKLQEVYGDVVKVAGLVFQPDMVFCFDPDDIETVFRNEGQWPSRGDPLPSLRYAREVLAKDKFQGYGGTFLLDGEKWQKARTLVNPIYMQPRNVKTYTSPMDEVANDFINKIRYLHKQSPTMPDDFSNEINKWALESICVSALNTRLGLLDPNLKSDSDERRFIDDVMIFFNGLYELDVQPSPWKYISTPAYRRFAKVHDRLVSFVQKQLDHAMEQMESGKNNEGNPILEKLLVHGKTFTFGTIMDTLVAGVDTTGRTVGALLYYLAANPDIQNKLREELVRVIPDKTVPLTPDIFDKLPYMRACIKETQRMCPISFGVNRITPKDIVLSGYRVSKGTNIICCTLAQCYNEKYFKNAKQFWPDRWLRKEGSRKEDINPWLYIPFGTGPRTCIGRRLASLEMEIVTTKVFRNFQLEWHQPEMKFNMTLLYGIADPLKITVTPLDDK